MKLFPKILNGRNVEPLRISRRAHIINVIVDSPTAFALAFGGSGQFADIAPIIVAQKNNHIVRHTQAQIVIGLHFFVERPNLLPLAGRTARNIGNYFSLIINNILKQTLIFLIIRDILVVVAFLAAHRGIAIAAHTNGNQVLVVLRALDSLTEKLIDNGFVRRIVPNAVLIAATHPLLVVAGHRLVVRRAHNNAELIGSAAIFGVIGIESPTPHCWPHKVSAQTKNQFKHIGIETVVAVIGSVSIFNPRS